MFASAILTLCLAAVALAAPQLPKRQGPSLITSCTQPNTAAITFDDGPYNYIYDIVNTLNSKNAKATFFFNGNNFRCIYDNDSQDRVRYAFNSGHQIASHTWSHPNLAQLPADQINNQLFLVEQAFTRIVGVVPAFMRPPFGSYNDQVVQIASQRGQSTVIWDFDSGDSLGVSAADSKGRYDALVSQRPSNVLALNHEVYPATASDVLPYAIDRLQGAGYRLVTVAECLGRQPYQSVGQPQQNDGSWRC